MKNSELVKASKREDGIDLISNMPDAILLLILSRLKSTEDVIRTSILSTRWRYLWTSIPSVEIYCFRECNPQGYFQKSKFKELVYWVLLKKSVDLDSFDLCCENYFSTSTVWRWTHYAVTKNVKELDLSFCPKEETEDIKLPHCLVTCRSLKVLRLNLHARCLRLPKFKGFPSLRVLNLTCVDFLEDDDSVKEFFESCPLLEDLCLLDCLICNLNLLCISSPTLKKLRIMNLDNVGLCGGINISCPKLVYLVLTGITVHNFCFEHLDSLKKAVIDPKIESNTIPVPFPGISRVEYLSIDLHFFSECIQAALDSGGLPNLKTLVLRTTIHAFTMDELGNILKYFPKLESLKLTITEEFDGPEQWELNEGNARKILTGDVERVEFFEFNGEKPKLVIDWEEMVLLELVFSWDDKAKYSH